MVDLLVIVVVLLEHTMKEFQISCKTFLVTDGSSSMYQSAKVDSIECLLAWLWCISIFRYRLVWVRSLYTVCPKEPSGLLYMSVSRKGKQPTQPPW